MRASTGLKTQIGLACGAEITRHVARVILTEEEAERILEWLPEGGDLAGQLLMTLNDAKATAGTLNARMANEERQWKSTKIKWMNPE